MAEGYKVFAVIDASGTYSKMAQEITLARVVQAGVVPIDTAGVASELQGSWNRADAQQWAEVYTKIFPAYQLLIESYLKAQDVVKTTNGWTRSVKIAGTKLAKAGAINRGPVTFPAVMLWRKRPSNTPTLRSRDFSQQKNRLKRDVINSATICFLLPIIIIGTSSRNRTPVRQRIISLPLFLLS